jgi:hypothetical protein
VKWSNVNTRALSRLHDVECPGSGAPYSVAALGYQFCVLSVCKASLQIHIPVMPLLLPLLQAGNAGH